MSKNDDVILVVNPDGSILGRRPFNGGTIALQRLQFSSNLGIAFCISAERVPQVIIYEDDQYEELHQLCIERQGQD